jgi:hypothetical protein
MFKFAAVSPRLGTAGNLRVPSKGRHAMTGPIGIVRVESILLPRKQFLLRKPAGAETKKSQNK